MNTDLSENEEIDTILNDIEIENGPFSIEELKIAKMQITEGKSSGPDGIPSEVIKRCDIDEILLSLCNSLIENGEKPDQWSVADIIPIPKSGNLSEVSNYRGISLTPVIAKMANKMILNRIQPVLDKHLRPNQMGLDLVDLPLHIF